MDTTSNVARVKQALIDGGHPAATNRTGGHRVNHVQGTKGDVGVQAVATSRNQAHHVNYVVTLAKAFPHAGVAIEQSVFGKHVRVRFPEEGTLSTPKPV